MSLEDQREGCTVPFGRFGETMHVIPACVGGNFKLGCADPERCPNFEAGDSETAVDPIGPEPKLPPKRVENARLAGGYAVSNSAIGAKS